MLLSGSLTFSQESYFFERGDTLNITCSVTNAIDWQLLILQKMAMDGSLVDIVHVNGSSGLVLLDPTAGYMSEITGILMADSLLNVWMEDIDCGDESIFVCSLLVRSVESPVDMIQANTSVQIIGKKPLH